MLIDKTLYDSIELDIKELESEIRSVGKERFVDVITRIISGDDAAGGFSSYIRRLFRIFAKNVEFCELSINAQATEISNRLTAQGYKPNVMPHGQCNVPDRRDVLLAKCRDDKHPVNTERACAKLCRQCLYHYNNLGFMESIRDDANQLKEDMNNFLLPPLQQKKAQNDYDNLIQVIELNEKKMGENKKIMIETRTTFCE